jgi:hypothetical protein
LFQEDVVVLFATLLFEIFPINQTVKGSPKWLNIRETDFIFSKLDHTNQFAYLLYKLTDDRSSFARFIRALIVRYPEDLTPILKVLLTQSIDKFVNQKQASASEFLKVVSDQYCFISLATKTLFTHNFIFPESENVFIPIVGPESVNIMINNILHLVSRLILSFNHTVSIQVQSIHCSINFGILLIEKCFTESQFVSSLGSVYHLFLILSFIVSIQILKPLAIFVKHEIVG